MSICIFTDRLYDLMAVVIHCGSGPNRGHYISIVKSHGFWLLFDDDMVDVSSKKENKKKYRNRILIDNSFFLILFLFHELYRKSKHQQLKTFTD